MRHNRSSPSSSDCSEKPPISVEKGKITFHRHIPLTIFAFERRMMRPEKVVCTSYLSLSFLFHPLTTCLRWRNCIHNMDYGESEFAPPSLIFISNSSSSSSPLSSARFHILTSSVPTFLEKNPLLSFLWTFIIFLTTKIKKEL